MNEARSQIRMILTEELREDQPLSVMMPKIEKRILEVLEGRAPNGRVGMEVKSAEVAVCDRRVGAPARSVAVFESRGFAQPYHGEVVEQIKDRAAALHAVIDGIVPPPGNNEVARLLSIAKTELETSVMFAVKAVSRFSPSPMAEAMR